MSPDKLEEVGVALDDEMAELRSRSPQPSQSGNRIALGWLSRRGRRLHLAIEDRRSGPVLVLSIWVETAFGEAFPVREGQFELAARQMPILASLLAKGIRLVRDRVSERLTAERSRHGGDG